MYQPSRIFFRADFVSDRTFFSTNTTFFSSYKSFSEVDRCFEKQIEQESNQKKCWLAKKKVDGK
jgi:hypothetical protein